MQQLSVTEADPSATAASGADAATAQPAAPSAAEPSAVVGQDDSGTAASTESDPAAAAPAVDVSNPDAVAVHCLLAGCHSVDDGELPIMTSDFQSKHMLPKLPEGEGSSPSSRACRYCPCQCHADVSLQLLTSPIVQMAPRRCSSPPTDVLQVQRSISKRPASRSWRSCSACTRRRACLVRSDAVVGPSIAGRATAKPERPPDPEPARGLAGSCLTLADVGRCRSWCTSRTT